MWVYESEDLTLGLRRASLPRLPGSWQSLAGQGFGRQIIEGADPMWLGAPLKRRLALVVVRQKTRLSF